MNWFWQRWFFDSSVPDLAIAKVLIKGKTKEITIESKGAKPVPIDLTVEYTEGSPEKIHRNIRVWQNGDKRILIPIINNRTVKKITLGSTYAADSNKTDNIWEAK